MIRISLVVVLIALAPAARAADWFTCAIKECSISKGNCGLKAGAAICDKAQIECKDSNWEPVRVIRKVGELIEVESATWRGWANARMLVTSGDLCASR